MKNRVFFPQVALDEWLGEDRVDLRNDELTIKSEGRKYRIIEAIRVLREVSGTPDSHELLGKVKSKAFLAELPNEAVAVHLHDTRGTALANSLAALDLGVRTIDASVGGLGGCPYAPGASGNLATEDLVYMLHGMGCETGVDLAKLIEVARLAEILVGRPLPGKVHQAGIETTRGHALGS